MVGWCSMGTFNDPCFPSRFPAGWTFPPHNGEAEWCAWAEACLDRAEIADLVLRMPSSPLLPADSHDDTDFEARFSPGIFGEFLGIFDGEFLGISVWKMVRFWGFKYERWWVHGDLTWFNHEQWGFIRIWPWQIVISWDFVGFSWLSWWIQLQ